MLAVDVQNLTRRYARTRRTPEVLALDDVSLQITAGEVHGLLGPNGAGKTTLVKVISTVLLPSSGVVRVLGHDVVQEARAVRELVGVVFGGERGLYTRVSARRNLYFWGALYGLRHREMESRCLALLDRVGLAGHADVPVETFSRGMKQRLHLARGLVHEPRVLFLDEPTSGMDPAAALEFRTLIRELTNEGRSVLLATHDMAEAEALCSNVTLIDGGKVLLSDRTATAAGMLGVRECVDFELADEDLVQLLRKQPFVASVEPSAGEGGVDGRWRALPVAPEALRELLGWLVERDVLSARRAEPSLSEVYLRLVGARGLRI